VNPVRALIVDDDFRVAGIHAAYVERIPGFTVVATVHTARDAARKHRPDLVLLDVYLPDRPGLDLYRSLPPCDLVLVTAAEDTATIASAIRAGALHYIVKPFRLHTLEAKLTAYRRMREMLGSRQELDQLGVDRVYRQLRAGDATDAQLPEGPVPDDRAGRGQGVGGFRDGAVGRGGRHGDRGEPGNRPALPVGPGRRGQGGVRSALWRSRPAGAPLPLGRVKAGNGAADACRGLLPRRTIRPWLSGCPRRRRRATMASFENTVTIRRPIAAVFAFLADFENIPAWDYAIVETRKVSPGPVGVGTTYRPIRSVPRRSQEGFEVTVFEPASRLEVQGARALPGEAELRTRAGGWRDEADERRGAAGLGPAEHRGAAGDLPRQARGGGESGHPEADPGTG
jgi:AmiR/NasT family two-component response regulator